MPDWSYQTIFRPLLFLLPAQTARDITLWTMGSLARLPLGPSIIDWMGHMKPADGLQQTFLKTNLPGPVGLAGELDRDLLGLPALQRFGFGFLEIGPVTLQPLSGEEPVERIVAECAVYDPYPLANLGLLSMLKKLEASPSNGTTRVAKIGHAPLATPRAAAAEQIFLMQALSPFCEWFALDTRFALDTVEWSAAEWEEYFCLLNQLLQDSALSVSLLLSFPADLQEAQMNLLVQLALENGIDGLQISGGIRRQAYGRLYGRSAFLPSLAKVQQLRERYGASLPLIIEGGIHEPEQALSLLAHGADLILLHSGLVYSGPGLPKRINEAILHQEQQSVSSMDATQDVSSRNALPRWWSGVLLGLGMIVAGVFAWLVAVTEVLLPYDEAFLGMTRAGIHQINERLLHFLAHDRISLAGTMISIGILYTALSWFALKRHEHWARQILLISGICGFGNLFYFWGFGYFDPLHALISTSLFPFFLHAVWSRYNAPVPVPLPDLTNDRIWRKGLWGQLCFVIIGCGLLGAGFIISM
ncbi:MAG: dihydroorotate dehydrogenase, partial [Clostridia bacterium]